MKKIKTMRIASVLLIAVLLTTSIISGTFAKYVTTGEVADNARVAKFGVVVSGSGNLFAENYFAVNSDLVQSGYSNHPATGDVSLLPAATLTVESSNGDKLVAPGTKNDRGLTLDITGAPEVDVTVKFDLVINDEIFLAQTFGTTYPDLTKNAYINNNGEMTSDSTFALAYGTYYPIRFTLAGETVEFNLDAIKAALNGRGNVTYTNDSVTGTLDNIKTALNAINGASGVYVNANKDLSTVGFGDGCLKLTWEWAFEGVDLTRVVSRSGAVTRTVAESIDKYDTLLGDLAAGNVAGVAANQYSLNVDIALSATVTQVD